VLADRYRIIGLLGRGGMGEVYRADDLKLGQPVALKFLPEFLAHDGAMLARFHAEARIARQVSHPNVCRVYDIGDVEGQPFLSMEYIDGEDLASLLRRIGRLPGDKAVEIARQLCAGLAAAHDTGVLHRDFKPSNVMIDGRGKARITDFGLASVANELRGDQVRSGTPAYMSPEQLTGKEVTVKSDLYALGLVLYELFTGKRAFDAGSLPELLQLRQTDTTPTSPSSLVKDLDPLVERVILRCLEKEPQKRPVSAIQVAAALPGGDPLAAALAAGETPSPEMVAAASKEGVLRPPIAAACLAGVLLGLALIVLLSEKVLLHRLSPLEKPPDVLADRAGEIIKRLGYTDPPTDWGYKFYANNGYLQHLRERDWSPARWDKLKTGQPAAFGFWYRQSPRYLEPYNRQFITGGDPPRNIAGMAGVSLDMRGRLLYFYAVPPQVDEPQRSPATPDWSVLFAEAGFDLARFKPTDPKWIPPHPYDMRAAWEGVYPDQPSIPIRIEAAAFRGRPVYFEIVNPWDKPLRQEQIQRSTRDKVNQGVGVVLSLGTLLGGILLARRNLRLGRGDRKGALRLAAFVFSMSMVGWVFLAPHVPTLAGELGLLGENLAWSLFVACLLWLVYIALEPFVRRRWPERIISWNRFLAGGFGDPLVGRDLLIGALFGLGIVLTMHVQPLVPTWLGQPPGMPRSFFLDTLFGIAGLVSTLSTQLINVLIEPAILLLALLLMSIILRKDWLAMGVLGVVLMALNALQGTYPPTDWVIAAIQSALFVTLIARVGLLATVFAEFFILLCLWYPMTADFSAWYAGSTLFALAIGVALAFYGFYQSLGGQPVFRGGLLQD
jgi:serine/threonine-protein kinase